MEICGLSKEAADPRAVRVLAPQTLVQIICSLSSTQQSRLLPSVLCTVFYDERARVRRWKKKIENYLDHGRTYSVGGVQLADIIDSPAGVTRLCCFAENRIHTYMPSNMRWVQSRISSVGFIRLLRRSSFRRLRHGSSTIWNCHCNSRLRLGPWRGHCPQGQSLPGRPSRRRLKIDLILNG